jgi:general secretion pathway protein N
LTDAHATQPAKRLKPLPLIAAGLTAFAIVFVALLPARLLVPLLPPAVSLGTLDGTLWKGSTDALAVHGRYVGALRWRLRPLQLLRARVAVDVDLSRAGGQAHGRLALGPGGRLEARDLAASMPIAAFAASIAPGGWSGTVHAELASLSLRPGHVPMIEGTVDVRDLVAPPPNGNAIGSYRVTFDESSLQSDKLVGQLQDLDGPMQVTGTVSLAADRSYVLEGLVAARSGASNAVIQTLRFLGTPDAQGRRPFSVAGTF